MHILITGASGSGTTTLGRALATELGAAFVDTDDLFWIATDPPYQQRRSREDRLALLSDQLHRDVPTVVSGSVQDWGAEVEDAFALIVFLQVPSEVRIPRLRTREFARHGKVDEDFIAWASQYDQGVMEGRSLARQRAWLDGRSCPVFSLIGAYALADSLAAVRAHLAGRSLQHANLCALSSADWETVDGMLAQGHTINAVALYRELTGCSIGQAQAAIGERLRQHGLDSFCQ